MAPHICFQTMSDQLGMYVDARALYLKIDFCGVPLNEVKKVAIAFYQFVQEFYQDQFVVSYGVPAGNYIKYPRDILREIIESKIGPVFVIEANVKTSSFYLKKHLNQFRKKLCFDPSIPNKTYSLDFDAYYDERLKPHLGNENDLKQALLKLFSENGKKPIFSYHAFDSQGLFYSMPEHLGSSKYHGAVFLSLSIGCLNEYLNTAAELFALELKHLCTALRTAGGQVSVCPYPFANGNDPYSSYFRERDLPQDNEAPEDCSPRYWNRVSYLSGCAWANVLSPMAQKRIGFGSLKPVENEMFYIEKLSSDGVFVRLNNSAAFVDVDDLKNLKHYLYPALYPGKSVWPIQHKILSVARFPRSRWEMVPLLSNEISIRDGYITFEKAYEKT